MYLFDPAHALFGPISDAGRANPYAGGTVIEAIAAQEAFGPFFS